MDLYPYLKSMADMDKSAIVICNLDHEIIYMNPAAKARYAKSGGERLVGSNLLDCHNEKSCEKIRKVIAWFLADKENNMVYTFHNAKENKDVYMVALRADDGSLIGYYEKHEYRNVETAALYGGIEED